MRIIIGLGNPGDKYIETRHNLGFWVVEELKRRLEVGRWKMEAEDESWRMDKRFRAEVVRLNTLLLIKPQTYMNNSGITVKALVDYFKIPVEDIVIIHDDLDLPLGKIKIKKGDSAAGHHGVESIIEKLGDSCFIRVRLGIGNEITFPEQFVLEKFTVNEKAEARQMVKQAVDALEVLVKEGLEKAQNQFN